MRLIRYVSTRISVARFKLYRCHQWDLTVTVDVTGIPREMALLQIAAFMGKKHPNLAYRVQRSKYRPGYAFIHFTEGEK